MFTSFSFPEGREYRTSLNLQANWTNAQSLVRALETNSSAKNERIKNQIFYLSRLTCLISRNVPLAEIRATNSNKSGNKVGKQRQVLLFCVPILIGIFIDHLAKLFIENLPRKFANFLRVLRNFHNFLTKYFLTPCSVPCIIF